jgi:PAS domain S-box-containing protein
MPVAPLGTDGGLPDLEAALRLFDETVRALEARARRLEEVLTVKQGQLQEANRRLEEKVDELDTLSRYLELIMSSVASGVVAVDASGVVTTINAAARRCYKGLDISLEGQQLCEVFPDSAIGALLSGSDAGPISGERRVLGADGRDRILEVVASPIVAPDGSIVGAVEVVEDVTEVRLLEEQVQRGERLRALGEMAAGVAHEIRNPLNGIEGFSSLLARDAEAGSRGERHARAIVEGVRDLNKTVGALLEFTRQRPPQKQDIVPADLLASCKELLEAEYADDPEAPRIDLIDRWPSGRTIAVDASQIRQVLLNLTQNGIQACLGAGGGPHRLALTIRATDNGDCQVSIDDSGPGIPEEARQHVFTPFFTTKDHGTGLGLAIVHTIVQLHDGDIAVEESPLGGARFVVSIPAV